MKHDILLLFVEQLKTRQQLRGNKYYPIIESIDFENFDLPRFQIVNYCNYCWNLGIPFSSQLLLFHNWPWKSWILRFNISTYWISSIDIFSIEYENFDSSSYTIHSILLRSTTKVFVPFFLISRIVGYSFPGNCFFVEYLNFDLSYFKILPYCLFFFHASWN